MTRIAVAGNPNAGKSTLFNCITGANAKVGNYPGVTVERREATARLPSGRRARVIDLPGCYSLTARSPEEEVAHHVLIGLVGEPPPEAIVCVVDAANLRRGLYLVLQLCELGLPVIVALNRIDVARTSGIVIDRHALEARLRCPVVETSARHGTGVTELLAAVEAHLERNAGAVSSEPRPDADAYGLRAGDRAAVVAVAGELLARGEAHSYGAALWLLTSDLDEVRPGVDPALTAFVRTERARLDEAFGRRVIQARYDAIDRLLAGVVDDSRARRDERTARLDRVLLHPVFGLAIFAAAMFVLFQAVFAWAQPLVDAIESLMGWLGEGVSAHVPLGLTRSLLVEGVIAGVGNVLVFLPQIALLFFGITLLEESGYMARAAFLLDRVMGKVGLHGKAFIPLMSGFACAVPAIMAARTVESKRDRLVTILVTPFMSCSARLPVYVLVTAAVFSSAPPLFGVLSVGGLVIAAMYALGFLVAIGVAFVLKRSVLRSPAPVFLMELPSYQVPAAREVARRVLERCRVFVVSTGSVVLALSMVLWALMTFPRPSYDEAPVAPTAAAIEQPLSARAEARAGDMVERRERAAALESSFAGRIGHAVEPVIRPLGFDWRIGIGLVASFAAREVLVSTLGQVYALDGGTGDGTPSLSHALRAEVDPTSGRPRFTPLVGVSLMVFFVLALQCLSTVATVKRETNSWKWPLLQLAGMTALAYIASLTVFQVGSALGWGT